MSGISPEHHEVEFSAEEIAQALQRVRLQRRPFATLAEAIKEIAKDANSEIANESTDISYICWYVGYEQLKRDQDGSIKEDPHFNYVLPVNTETAQLLLKRGQKADFKQQAEQIHSRNPPLGVLQDQALEDIKNGVQSERAYQFLRSVYQLIYSFRAPVNYIEGRVCKYIPEDVQEEHPKIYWIRLLPPEAGEDLRWIAIYDEQFSRLGNRKYSQYMEPLSDADISFKEWVKPEKEPEGWVACVPIFDGLVRSKKTLRGFLGWNWNWEGEHGNQYRGLLCLRDYLTKERRLELIEERIIRAYQEGIRNYILDSYNDKDRHILADPIKFWCNELRMFWGWTEVQCSSSSASSSTGLLYDVKDGQAEIYIDHLINHFGDSRAHLSIQSLSRGYAAKTISKTAQGEGSDRYLENRVYDAVSLLGDILHKREALVQRQRALRTARGAAVAQIMARNLSHNIGSHVLARLSSDDSRRTVHNKLQDLVKENGRAPQADSLTSDLNSYLRTRMDFIADVATATPVARIAMALRRDVLEYLYHRPDAQNAPTGQMLLLNHISGIDALGVSNIEIQHIEDDGNDDPEVAISNGVLGTHAVYNIIENVIRNSAKHAFGKNEVRKLCITLRTRRNEALPELLEVFIHDNLRNGTPDLITDMNVRIRSPILTESDEVHPDFWGVKEMKICAAYLRGVPHEALSEERYNPTDSIVTWHDGKTPPLLEAVGVPIEETGGQSHLGYRFYLPLPKHAFVMDPEHQLASKDIPESDREKCLKDLEGKGINLHMEESIPEAQPVLHDFLIVSGSAEGNSIDEGGNVTKLRQNNLPLRVLHADDYPSIVTKARTMLRCESDADDFVNELWKRRIEARCHDLRLVLLLETFHQVQAETWNKLSNLGLPVEIHCKGEPLNINENRQEEDEVRQVIYERHGWQGYKHGSVLLTNSGTPDHVRSIVGAAFYDPCRGDGRHPINSLLENPPKDNNSLHRLALELLEAGACGIIVLDERIQELALSNSNTELYSSHPCPVGEILQLNRIFIPTLPEKGEQPSTEDTVESLRVDLDNPLVWERNLRAWLNQFEDLSLESEGCSHTRLVKGIDFLVVHLGVLEKLFPVDSGQGTRRTSEQHHDIGNQINKWEQNGVTVIVTSGRGSPPLPRNIGCRFLHYSQVARPILEARSKFHLCKALFAARRL